jgi:hypothetical protein
VLEEGVGVAVALVHDALRLVVLEEHVVLQRAAVFAAGGLHAQGGKVLEFGDLAGGAILKRAVL